MSNTDTGQDLFSNFLMLIFNDYSFYKHTGKTNPGIKKFQYLNKVYFEEPLTLKTKRGIMKMFDIYAIL